MEKFSKTLSNFYLNSNYFMAYNEALARRIDALIKGKKDFVTKKMFGGVGYLYKGNMCVGVYKDELIVRCAAGDTEKFLEMKNVRPFDITNKPMKGWLMVSGGAIEEDQLEKWFDDFLKFPPILPKK
jgi:hypothetical protein